MARKNPFQEYRETEAAKDPAKKERARTWETSGLPFVGDALSAVGPWVGSNLDEMTGHTLPYIQKGVGEAGEALAGISSAIREKIGLAPKEIPQTPSVGEISADLKATQAENPITSKLSQVQGAVGRGVIEDMTLRRVPGFTGRGVGGAALRGLVTGGADRGTTNAIDADLAARRGEETKSPLDAALSLDTLGAAGMGAGLGAAGQGLANLFGTGSRVANALPKGVKELPEGVAGGVREGAETTTQQGMKMSLPELIEREGVQMGGRGAGETTRNIGQTMQQKLVQDAAPDPLVANIVRNAAEGNKKLAGPLVQQTGDEAARLTAEASPLIGKKIPITGIGSTADEALKRANQMAPEALDNPTGLIAGAVQKDSPARLMHAAKESPEAAEKLTAAVRQRAPAVLDQPVAKAAAEAAVPTADVATRKLPSMAAQAAEKGSWGVGGIGALGLASQGQWLPAMASAAIGPAVSLGKAGVKKGMERAGAGAARMMTEDPLKALGLLEQGSLPAAAAVPSFARLLQDPDLIGLLGRLPAVQELARLEKTATVRPTPHSQPINSGAIASPMVRSSSLL